VLPTCNPSQQQISAPFSFITKDRKFVETEDAGFLTSKLGYSFIHHTSFKDTATDSRHYLKSCA